MKAIRARALQLRLQGQSYNEIQKALSIPKSTLSGWFKNVVLSDTAKSRLASRANIGTAMLIKRNKMQTHTAEQRARETRATARKEIPILAKRDLLIVGAVLYWAEGYKRLLIRDDKERMSHVISFVNADSHMVKVFVRFLQEIMGISSEDIHLTMRLYPHINETEARTYWREATGLTDSHFQNTTQMISIASKGKRPYNRLPYGTLQVAVYDTTKFHHLMGLIEGVQARM